jgi:hypothetical protein
MPLGDRDRERRHEARALGDARRKLLGPQVGERLLGDIGLSAVVLRLRDASQSATRHVARRLAADVPVPAGVMPWHADREVLNG